MYLGLLCLSLIACVVSQSGHPEFEQSFEETTLEAGAFAEITCSASGDEPITYSWKNSTSDSITTDHESSVHFRPQQHGSILVFNPTDKSHQGVYTCLAENRHGKATKNYLIKINGSGDNDKETAITTVVARNVTDKSVEFHAETLGNIETLKVDYIEKAEKILKGRYFQLGEDILIDGLIPGGRYNFNFTITKPNIGFQRSLEVVLFPGQPEVIFRSMKNNMIEIGWSSPVDDFMRDTIDEYILSYYTVQMQGGNYWKPSDCKIEIKMKKPCLGYKYTIAGLSSNTFYEISFTAHTSAGYGVPFKNKIFLQN